MLDHQTIAGSFPDYEINHLKPTCGKIAAVFYLALFSVKKAALAVLIVNHLLP